MTGVYLRLAPGGELEKHPVVGDTLALMQSLVGGDIEVFMNWPSMSRDGVLISALCHEEGRLLDLPPCCIVVSERGLFDICGPVIITALDVKTGDTLGLTDQEAAEVLIAPGPDVGTQRDLLPPELRGLPWIVHKSLTVEAR